MVEAEKRILTEYSEALEADTNLPSITPELLKSRRTHSLQLALGDILNNRVSIQSAARKYNIPRETLRRHYYTYQAQQTAAPPANILTPRRENTSPAAALNRKKKQDKMGGNSNDLKILNILEDYKLKM